jgi:hypothetical protein
LGVRSLSVAVVLILCAVVVFPANAAPPGQPLLSVDYVSSGRANCDSALSLYGVRTCLLSLQAVVTGGTPPIHVKWILSNGTRLRGQQISLAITYGDIIYGVCLMAVDSRGNSVFGGHWEYGINYGSDQYHQHKYAPVNVWYANVSPPCSTVGKPVDFTGNVFCSSECAPAPIISTWSFGNGHIVYGQNATYSYPRTGIYSVELTGTDSLGRTSSTTYPVIVVRIGHHHRPLWT